VWILKRAKTTTFLSRMIFPSDFFSFVNIQMEKQLQQINAIRKKGWQIQDSKADHIT